MVVQTNKPEKKENVLRVTMKKETDLANINMPGSDKQKKHEIDIIDVL